VFEVVIDTLKKNIAKEYELNPDFLNNIVIRAPSDTYLRFYYFVQIGCVHIKSGKMKAVNESEH
jgi:hypothetical protein